jgi:hypothetical protein
MFYVTLEFNVRRSRIYIAAFSITEFYIAPYPNHHRSIPFNGHPSSEQDLEEEQQ